MMDEGWVIIAGLAILCWAGVAIASMFFKSSSRKNKQDTSSLTTGELRTLISDAVDDAVQPLQQKVERLERRLPEARSFDTGAQQEERAQDVSRTP